MNSPFLQRGKAPGALESPQETEKLAISGRETSGLEEGTVQPPTGHPLGANSHCVGKTAARFAPSENANGAPGGRESRCRDAEPAGHERSGARTEKATAQRTQAHARENSSLWRREGGGQNENGRSALLAKVRLRKRGLGGRSRAPPSTRGARNGALARPRPSGAPPLPGAGGPGSCR